MKWNLLWCEEFTVICENIKVLYLILLIFFCIKLIEEKKIKENNCKLKPFFDINAHLFKLRQDQRLCLSSCWCSLQTPAHRTDEQMKLQEETTVQRRVAHLLVMTHTHTHTQWKRHGQVEDVSTGWTQSRFCLFPSSLHKTTRVKTNWQLRLLFNGQTIQVACADHKLCLANTASHFTLSGSEQSYRFTRWPQLLPGNAS